MKRVQFIRHTGTEADAFTGYVGEITVDTSRDELRLHDGSLQGGHRIMSKAALDALYQPLNAELNAISELDAATGFLTRLGVESFARRSLLGTAGQINVEYGNGVEGDPTISIPATITTDHTIAGDWTFSEAITASGGVTGNLTGNVTGNLTGNVTGNVTGNTTGTHTGAVDVSAATLTLADNQIAMAKISGLSAAIGVAAAAGAFEGMICLYYGDTNDIPDGWQVCDGTNGTPNVKDKFLVVAGTTYAANSTGGAATHTHTPTIDSGGAHTHAGSVGNTTLTVSQIPAHPHALMADTSSETNSSWTSALFMAKERLTGDSAFRYALSHTATTATLGKTGDAGGGGSHNHTLTVDSGGAHTHTGTNSAGSSLPPYYALVAIMYIG